MADTTMGDRFREWRTSRTRSEKQITDELGVIWMKEWYNELKKKLISIGRNNLFSDQIGLNIHAYQSTYTLPIWTTDTRPTGGYKDFVSVIQMEVAYRKDSRTNQPVYHVCSADLGGRRHEITSKEESSAEIGLIGFRHGHAGDQNVHEPAVACPGIIVVLVLSVGISPLVKLRTSSKKIGIPIIFPAFNQIIETFLFILCL